MNKWSILTWCLPTALLVAAVATSASRYRAADHSLAEVAASLDATMEQAQEVMRLKGSVTRIAGVATANDLDDAMQVSRINAERIASLRVGEAQRERRSGSAAADIGRTAVLELESISIEQLGRFLAALRSVGPRWRATRIDLDLSPGGDRCNAVLHLDTPLGHFSLIATFI